MKNIFLFIGILFFGYFAQAQSNAAERISLSKKYAPKLLEDFRDNAKNKVEDLFTYFQMLTDASLTNDLKKEVIKNIKNCFQNQNPEVLDFTSDANQKITLDSFIDKLLHSEPIVFEVSETWQNTSETALSWNANYMIKKTKSGVSQNIKVNQLVYLFEQNKTFGNSGKNVTVSFLGRMINQ